MTRMKVSDQLDGLQDLDKEQFIDIIQNANDLIQCVDKECNFIYVNRTWLEKLGYSQEEMKGLNLWDVIHPDDRDQCQVKFMDLISGEDLGIFRTRFISKTGGIIHVEGSVNCKIENGEPTWTRGIFRDISDKVNEKDEVENIEEFYGTVINSFTLPLIVVEAKSHVIEMANDEAVKIYGEFENGMKCHELTHHSDKPCDSDKHPCPFKAVRLTRSPAVIEHVHKDKDGNDRTFQVNCFPIFNQEGEVSKFIEFSSDITEKKKLQDELSEREEKFRLMAENQNDVVICVSMDGTLEYCSPAIKEFSGYDPEEEVGENIIKYFRDEKEIPAIMEEMGKMMISKEPAEIQFLYRPKIGDPFYVSVSGKPRIENDEVTGIVGVMRDISNDRLIKKFTEIQRDISKFDSMEIEKQEALDKTLGQILEIDLIDQCGYYDYDWKSDELHLIKHRGISEKIIEMIEKYGPDSKNYKIVMEGNPVLLDWEKILEIFKDTIPDPPVKTIIVVPLGTKNDIHGALIIGSTKINDMKDVMKDGILSIGNYLDSMMSRMKTKQEKLQTQRRLETALDGAQMGMWEYDLTTGGVVHDDRFLNILGYVRDDIENELDFWENLVHPDDFEKGLASLMEHVTGNKEIFEMEIRYKSKDGKWRWFLDKGKGFDPGENGRPKKVSGTHLDITDRKNDERKLKESEERFRNIFDQSPLGIYQTTPEGNINLVNQALIDMLGYDSLEDLKRVDLETFGYLENGSRKDFKEKIEENDILRGFEQTWKKKDGSPIQINEFSRAIRDEEGKVILYEGIIEDISEKKIIQKKLSNMNDKLKRSQELANVGSWVMDLESNLIECSEITCRILDIDCSGDVFSYDDLMDLIYQDDVEVFSNWIHDWLDMGGFDTGEFRIQRNDGSIGQVIISGEMALDEGKGTQLLGSILDITDLKNAQKEIEESENRMRSILDHIQAGVMIIEVDGCSIIEANPKALEMIGLSREEVIGRRCNNFICPNNVCECPIIDLGKTVDNSEKVLVNKDGEHVPVLKTVTPVKIAGKECLLESFVDISDMKKAQKELEESEKKFKTISSSAQDAIVMIDNDGKISFWNEAAETIFGYANEEALDQHFHHLITPEHYHDAHFKAFDHFKETGVGGAIGKTLELEGIRKDGSIVPVELGLSSVKLNGKWNAIGIMRDITERKKSNEMIRKSQELLSSFMQSATEGIILLDKDLKLLMANEKGFNRFDVPKEEAIGKRITDLTILEEGSDRIEAYKRTIETGEPYEIPELIWNWTPGVPQYSLKAFKVGDGLGLIISDITKLKEMEYESNLQKTYMDDLFEGAPEGIAVLDQDDMVQKVNKEFTNLFGYTKEEAIGKNIQKLIIPEGKEKESRDLTLNVVEGETVYMETQRQSKDGELIDVSILGTPIHISDGETKTYAIYRDIREEIKQKRELEEAKEVAEEAARSKSEFLANMSHEIRTPMNAILGFTDILSEQELTGKQRAYLDSISSSGKTLLTLINDILDLSKIDAGKLEINMKSTNPHTVFKEMEQVFHKKVADKGIGFDVEVSELVPKALIIDEVRLRQILLNLSGNAVKFTDEGSIKLSVDRTNIEDDGSMIDLRFSIKDTGIGIPEDQKDKIFGTFDQMKGQDSGKYGGTGLGLAITKRLVEMMNGKIWVESEVGRGSEFFVEFYQVAVGSTYESEDKEQYASDLKFHYQTVLIVDDIIQNRMLVKGMLEDRGLIFQEAENGKVAIELLKEGGIDLALMDMKMPVMTGYEATKLIKADQKISDTPIIALTASAMEGDEEEILQMGCDGYLRKPVTKRALINELARFLEHDESEIEEQDDNETEKECIDDDPAKIKEHMPELLGELKLSIGSALETGSMDDAMEVSERMKSFGEECGLGTIAEWGAKLKDLVESFEIEGMMSHMKDYDRLVSRLQAFAEGEGE